MLHSYEVAPGRSVGPFKLGDTLWHVLDLVRSERARFPKVELAWDTSKAHTSDLTLSLPHLTLYFPHPSQRLTLLKVTSIPSSSLTLSYEGQVLHSSTQSLTRGVVGRVLGPTHSGNGGSLVYPGVKFEVNTQSSSGREDRIESVTVVARDEGSQLEITPLRAVTVKPNEGIMIHIPHDVEVKIGETTSQDILLDLGPPLRKYIKEDDRMERIWGEQENDPNVSRGTFWNYFQYGMDFLISPDGLVAKILLHSNIPGTPLFQRHARCPWSLPTASGPLNQASPLASFRSHMTGESADHLQVPTPSSSSGPNTSGAGGKKGKKHRNASPSTSDASDSSEVKSSGFVKGAGPGQPEAGGGGADGMILDRVVEGGLDGVEGLPPSRLVDFDGLILEEDQGSGGITSVLVFKAD